MNDRLYRSRDERMVAGVAGGLAERLDVDPSLIRVLWVILAVVSGGLFLLAYVVMAIVVPESPLGADRPSSDAGSHDADRSGAGPGWGAPAAASAAAGATAFSAGPSSFETGPEPIATGADPAVGDPTASLEPGPGLPPETLSDAPPAEALWPPATGSGPPPVSSQTTHGRHRRRDRRGSGAPIAGIFLVVIGGYLLARTMLPQLDLGAFWPVLLVIFGIALIVGSFRPGSSPDA